MCTGPMRKSRSLIIRRRCLEIHYCRGSSWTSPKFGLSKEMAHNLTQIDEYIPSELIALTHRTVTPEEFEQLCTDYTDLRLELTSTGELIVMPGTGLKTGKRNSN